MSEWSIRRIHAISELNNASNYLEIGVYMGQTFHHINLPFKDAVDPSFKFDISLVANEQIRLFEITSNQFFSSNLPRLNYDLVFLDGMHVFSQIFRDFTSALALSHSRTVFLIDDTIPCDVYSSLPNHQQAVQERKRANPSGNNNAWHGDVFKVILAINDFFPTLTFATITNNGNPQTIVWHEPRKNFIPLIDDFEKISRASYFDLSNYASAFKLTTEEDAINRLRQGLEKNKAFRI